MSKIQASGDIDQVKPEDVQRYVDIFAQDVLRVVNGGLDFATNFNCKVMSVSLSNANADTAVAHNLGRVTSTYLIISKSVSSDIYNGSAGTSSTLYLKATVVPVTVTVVVL